MIKRLFKITILLLLSALMLTGCWLPPLPVYVSSPTQAPPEYEEPPENIDEPPAVTTLAHGQFSLRYDPESTMNPITAYNRDNITLSTLLYESLFMLDENLVAHSLLCSKWSTDDNMTFTFEIMPNVAMHDGSILTADDVAYSISSAVKWGRHKGKLHSIKDVTSDGELTVTVEISSPNARFIRLLDIPIIKYGTVDDRLPPGTGPFVFTSPESFRLTRFSQHREFDNLPLSVIYLQVFNDSNLTEMFDEGNLSLLSDDPSGAYNIRINLLHEPRYYNTTALQYLGFNAESPVVRDPDVRRAIGCAVERQYIVENIMNVPRPGQTVAAPVAISPMFDMYDTAWEYRAQDPLVEMAALLEQAGLADYNQDGALEMRDLYGNYFEFTLDFIVNIENAHKLAAAERIAESLGQVGFSVQVRRLPWTNFIKELEDGKFDMYYGETQLGADFDLSPLLMPGENSINYGKTANTTYKGLIDDFLAASTPEEISYTGGQLCLAITQNAPFVPILYKRHVIYSPMGVISGAVPSQSGIFHNFQNWTIDLE